MGAKPTHKLTVKKKDGTGITHRIGSAWQNEKGWFSIQLDPCITLTDRDDVFISLYPNEPYSGTYDDQEPKRRPESRQAPSNPYYGNEDDSEIPF